VLSIVVLTEIYVIK